MLDSTLVPWNGRRWRGTCRLFPSLVHGYLQMQRILPFSSSLYQIFSFHRVVSDPEQPKRSAMYSSSNGKSDNNNWPSQARSHVRVFFDAAEFDGSEAWGALFKLPKSFLSSPVKTSLNS